MPGYYRTIPDYVASHKSISAAEKIFYLTIVDLVSNFGYCFATNKYLAQCAGVCEKTIRNYLSHLSKAGIIVIELEYNFIRKIWLAEAWGTRQNHEKAYGPEKMSLENEIQSKILYGGKTLTKGVEKNVSTHGKSLPLDNTTKNTEIKHREELPEREKWAKPVRSSLKISSSEEKKEPGVRNLPREMTDPKLSPPTPGRPEMVAKTKEFLSRPFTIGSQKVRIHQDDVQYFFGFSPTVIANALEIVHQHSRGGIKIRKIVAYLFKQCCKLRRQR